MSSAALAWMACIWSLQGPAGEGPYDDRSLGGVLGSCYLGKDRPAHHRLGAHLERLGSEGVMIGKDPLHVLVAGEEIAVDRRLVMHRRLLPQLCEVAVGRSGEVLGQDAETGIDHGHGADLSKCAVPGKNKYRGSGRWTVSDRSEAGQQAARENRSARICSAGSRGFRRRRLAIALTWSGCVTCRVMRAHPHLLRPREGKRSPPGVQDERTAGGNYGRGEGSSLSPTPARCSSVDGRPEPTIGS